MVCTVLFCIIKLRVKDLLLWNDNYEYIGTIKLYFVENVSGIIVNIL